MSDTSTALVTIPTNGVDTYRMSTDAAAICGAIVKATAQAIQGRKYVKVEGWQAIAVAHGCAASSGQVERVEGGMRAVGQVRRMDTGGVIAEAEGFVGEDEPVWFGGEGEGWENGRKVKKTFPKRPDYAIRAMAQTRAISRACRSAFAHVVVMIDKDLSTTPAEEMPDGGFGNGHSAPNDYVEEARKDGLVANGETRSQYQVDKVKKAIDNEWRIVNTTPKGQEDQAFAYMEMARSPEDVAMILRNNEAIIEAAPWKGEINESADKLIQWMEKQSAPALQ